ncbi:MAG TPA: phosphoadenylyl-sulfate reductase [Usitatibacter sp.]|nr:phosphoadenylyl-sulfate reductase [Usitatibacter sp.]
MSHEARVQRARRLLAGIEKNHSAAALESAFGAEDMVLLDLIARDGLAIRVFTVDTGRLPWQTHELIADVRRRYGIDVDVYSPWPDSVSAYVEENGHDGFYDGTAQREACCNVRKSEPLRRALAGKRAWISSLRDEQAGAPLGESVHDAAFGIARFHPLAAWSEDDVWTYLHANAVPYNALHKLGYVSIGCEPCTRALRRGEHPRTARWWWEQPDARHNVIPIRPLEEAA